MFTLVPETDRSSLDDANDIGRDAFVSTFSRGGNEPPILRPIALEPPSQSDIPPKHTDSEARRQALERRNLAHHELLKQFEAAALRAGLTVKCDQYADALCDGDIFEMKSINGDEIAQIRAAIGQLYHYMFIHREIEGYGSPGLYAVFDHEIDQLLSDFLVKVARIGVIWRSGERFHADDGTENALPWLFVNGGLRANP